MSAQQGTIYVKLDLDTSAFDRGLEQSANKAEKSGSFLSRAFEFATGGVILSGLKATASAIGGVAKSMIAGNAEFETYQTQFGVLLGSTEKAKQRLDELAKFGASTPFELPELVRADKVLTSFGIHSQDLLTIVGDVASGTGTSFEDMALLMGKFSSGATGEAISRFQELGVATKQELAKMGLAFDKAGSLTTPVAEAMPILEKLMKEKFGGMMDAQSKTFSGMISNLQDWVGSTLRTLGQPIFEVVKDKLGALLVFLSSPEVQAGITSFAQALATGIGTTIQFISTTVIPAFMAVMNALMPVINQVSTTTSDFGAIWQALQPIIESVTNIIRAIVITIFSAIQKFLEKNGDDIQSFFNTTWTTIKDIIITLAKIINATLVPIFNAIAKFIKEHGDTIVALLTNTWNIIKGVINIALAIIQGVLKTTLALIQGDWSGAWNAIKTMFSAIWDNIKIILNAALGNIKLSLSLTWDAAKALTSAAFGSILSSITSTLNNMKSTVNGAVNSIRSSISGAWSAITGTTESAWSSVKNTVTNKLRDAKDSLQDIANSIRSALSNIWGDVRDSAASAWHGIANAIGDAFSGVSGQIKDVVNQAIRYINRLIRGYNEVASTLGLGSLDTISQLATGTSFFKGGLALVGERGPELVALPRGSQVYSNGQTQQIMNRNFTQNLYVNQAGSLVDEMQMALATYGATY